MHAYKLKTAYVRLRVAKIRTRSWAELNYLIQLNLFGLTKKSS